VPLDEDSFAYAFRSNGELTYRLENDCENTNTHSHDNVLLVVLAHLRRRWSLSGRDGFGTLSPSRRAMRFSGSGNAIFRAIRRGGRADRMLGSRPISSSRVQRACTPARPVKPQRSYEAREVDWTRWRVRSRSTRRVRSQVGAYWNRPDASTVASGQYKRRVRLGLSAAWAFWQPDARARPIKPSGASGHFWACEQGWKRTGWIPFRPQPYTVFSRPFSFFPG
jgi:hypothetical protein